MVAGRMLEDFPGCGSTQQPDSPNQHPWLGALYAVPLPAYSEKETDRFVVPVALLSAKTKLRPNWPTIIVATGDIFDTKLMNRSSGSVSREDLVAWVSACAHLFSVAHHSIQFYIGKWINAG